MDSITDAKIKKKDLKIFLWMEKKHGEEGRHWGARAEDREKPICPVTRLVTLILNYVINIFCIKTCPLEISKLQKGAKRPHCNFDFMNKIEVRSNTVFYQLGRLNNTRAQTF